MDTISNLWKKIGNLTKFECFMDNMDLNEILISKGKNGRSIREYRTRD